MDYPNRFSFYGHPSTFKLLLCLVSLEEEYNESEIIPIILGFVFYIKIYILLENIVSKKVVYTITFYLQFLCVAVYFKQSNDSPKLNVHKYTNYNKIERYIYRLSTTTHIFIAMDYLILMSEKRLHFRKWTRGLMKEFFSHPMEVTGSMCFVKYFQIMCISKICTKS